MTTDAQPTIAQTAITEGVELLRRYFEEFVPKKQEMYQSGWIAARVTHLLRAGLLRKTMRGRYLITAGQADRSEAP